jgi:aminoglycoside phosphotransferase (APT) family kinase protein
MRNEMLRAVGRTRPVKLAEGREAEILSWGPNTVLRLYRQPGDRDRADREMIVLQAVRAALPFVPAALERVEWDGRPGVVMERVEGRDLLTEIGRRPWRLLELGAVTGRVHAEIHRVTVPERLPSLGEVVERRIRVSAAIPEELLRTAALEQLRNLPDGNELCHGDFHPANILLAARGPVVIDWAHATRGPALSDFARTTLMMRVGSLPPGAPAVARWGSWMGRGVLCFAYRRAYKSMCPFDEAALRRWEFVRGVERFSDEIPEERFALLREVKRLQRRLGADS